MRFTAHELRYDTEDSYPALYAFLRSCAQRFLGPLGNDAFEVDQVAGYVVEYLVRLGLLGGGNQKPLTALDELTDEQFYAFLSRSARNRAIDQLRRRRIPFSTMTELQFAIEEEDSLKVDLQGLEREDDPLNEVVEPLGGHPPFSLPEEATIESDSQKELYILLKESIKRLKSSPQQLQVVLQELEAIGADKLLQDVILDLNMPLPDAGTPLPHKRQQKYRAYKRLRHYLQQHSNNSVIKIASHLASLNSLTSDDIFLNIQTLMHEDLSEDDVRRGLRELTAGGLLEWNGEEVIRITPSQLKQLAHFYKNLY